MIREHMLDSCVERVYRKASKIIFYRNLYEGLNTPPSSLSDIPFLTEDHVRGVTRSVLPLDVDGITVYFTSGTTSDPKAIYYSKSGVDNVSEYLRWFCKVEGIAGGERTLVLMDQFFWGIGQLTSRGHTKAGNIVIPVDSDLPDDVLASLVSLAQPTVISSIPSVLIKFKDLLAGLPVKLIETTGEVLDSQTRKSLEQSLGAPVYDAYGLTECAIGVECSQHSGYHYQSERVHLEVLDPISLSASPEGRIGEIVVTSDLNSYFPLVRYRTRDYGAISREPCPCGRDEPRVWLFGRVEAEIPLYEGSRLSVQEIIGIIQKTSGMAITPTVSWIKKGSITVIQIHHNGRLLESMREPIAEAIYKFNHETIYLRQQGNLQVQFPSQ